MTPPISRPASAREQADETGVEPVVALALIKDDLQAAEAEADEARPM